MIDSILEKAGLNSLASTEILSTPDALNVARTYVRENYPECRCALLFGSYSRGDQRLFSDLDILIILPKFAPGRGPEQLRTIHSGVRVEVFLLTEKTFSDVLLTEKRLGTKVFYTAISEGVFVGGAAGLAEKLKHSAKLLFQDARKMFLDADSLASMRVQITNQLLKLSCAEEYFDRVHYAAHAFNALGLAIIKVETGENISVDKFPKALREHDPAAAQAFQSAFVKVCTTGEASDFIDSAGALLDRLGGPAWSGVSGPIRLPPKLAVLRQRLMSLRRQR
jgi:predicted nucleotidyltransferase